MRHRFTRSWLRLTGLAAAASAGLIAFGTAASASGPAGPVMSALPNAAAIAAGPQALHETYACDTSVLRPNSSGPSLGSLNPTAVLTVPAAGVAGQRAKVTLAVAATPLSSAISAVLPAVNSIDLTSTASVNATSDPGCRSMPPAARSPPRPPHCPRSPRRARCPSPRPGPRPSTSQLTFT